MRVNPLKSVLLTVATCGALAGGLLAENFTWSGVAADLGWPGWPVDCNWHPGPVCVYPDRYPDDTDDDAIFPDNSGTAWEVGLVTVAIGQLTIEESVNFNGATSGNGPVLTVNSLVIDPAGGEVIVTLDGKFSFVANSP